MKAIYKINETVALNSNFISIICVEKQSACILKIIKCNVSSLVSEMVQICC